MVEAEDKKVRLEFHHGALVDSYEKQVNSQGYTYGEYAQLVQDIGFGIVCAHIHGCITDSEYTKILQRFHKKILCNGDYLKESEVEG